jgi:hypothetical protein
LTENISMTFGLAILTLLLISTPSVASEGSEDCVNPIFMPGSLSDRGKVKVKCGIKKTETPPPSSTTTEEDFNPYLEYYPVKQNNEEDCDTPSSPKPPGQFLDFASDTSKSCDYSKNLLIEFYTSEARGDVCKCLKSQKHFKETSISPELKKKFDRENEYEKSISTAYRKRFEAIIPSFRSLNRYMISKDHSIAFNLSDDDINHSCNLKNTLAKMKSRLTTAEPHCDLPKEDVARRIKDVFGLKGSDLGKEIDTYIEDQLAKEDSSISEEQKSLGGICSSYEEFLNMKLSPGGTGAILDMVESEHDFSKFIAKLELADPGLPNQAHKFSQKEMLKEAIKYHPVFKAITEDSHHYSFFRSQLTYLKTQNKPKFAIFHNYSTNALPATALESSCMNLQYTLEDYTCHNRLEIPHPTTVLPHLNRYLSDKVSDPLEREAASSYYTQKYSCVEGVDDPFNPHDQIRTLNTTFFNPNGFNDNPLDDYKGFRDVFCKKPASDSSISSLVKGFINKNQSNNINLQEFFNRAETMKALGFKINFNADNGNKIEIDLLDEEQIKIGRLPTIQPMKWNLIADELKGLGLKDAEIKQLYGAFEMLTNRKYSEIEDVYTKVAEYLPDSKPVSIAEVKQIIERGTVSSNVPLERSDLEQRILLQYAAVKSDSARQDNKLITLATTTDPSIKEAIRTEMDEYKKNGGMYSDTAAKINTEFPVTESLPGIASGTVAKDVNAKPAEAPGDSSTPEDSGTKNQLAKKEDNSQTIIPPSPVEASPYSHSDNKSNSRQDDLANLEPPQREKKDYSDYKKDFDYSADNDPYIQELKNKIAKSQAEQDKLQKQARSLFDTPSSNSGSNNSSSGTESFKSNARANNYVYPDNVPFPNGNGGHYYPNESSGELSSRSPASSDLAQHETDMNSHKGGSGGASGASGAGASGSGEGGGGGAGGLGGFDTSSLAGLGSDIPGSGKGKNSDETEEEARKRLNLPVFEHPRVVPYALVDVVGSIDKVVLLLGLEGKRFKTIEATQDFKTGSIEKEIKYYLRTFDFVPEGEFSELKEEFVSKEARAEAFTRLFGYPKTKDNLVVSKKYAAATKEVEKQEVSHSYVLKIQDDVMSEGELREIIETMMDKIK